MEKYVKPDAELVAAKAAPEPAKLTAELESKILEIAGVIDAEAVQKKLAITGLSADMANAMLKQMHAAGKIKTVAERTAELAPKIEEAK